MICPCTWCFAQVLMIVTPGVLHIHPFLTNLEDEISVKGVGFVKPKNGKKIKIK
jgi:hypothetical protein